MLGTGYLVLHSEALIFFSSSAPKSFILKKIIFFFVMAFYFFYLSINILNSLTSGVAWQLTLSRPKAPSEASVDQVPEKPKNTNDGELCIVMFRPLISSDKAVSTYN